MRRALIAIGVAGALGGPATAAAEIPAMTPPITVVPSAGLPPKIVDNRSNNNVHVIRHEGRYFMVFRTARWHIASEDAVLYVVSSKDQVHWRFEGSFSYGNDLREARLMSWHGQLFLYFALLGANPAAFEPGGTLATREISTGHWTTPQRILMDDFIPWAVKVHDGVPYMLGYTGGGGTFTPDPPDKQVYWLTTSDGFDWHPVVPNRPVVYTGQCGETDFAFRADGSLITACQTENDDKLGWGAKVCTAPADDTAAWTCRGDTRRLDSPFVFTYRGQVYVIARRQPNFNGEYDLHYDYLPDRNAKFAAYDASYAGTTKRCALWSIDPATRDFRPLVDIPGQGDTCYPAVINEGGGRFTVYNYTSPLDGPDEPWGTALVHGPTLIYRMNLLFGPAASQPQASCMGRRATVTRIHGRRLIRGTSGPDVIVGSGGADRIQGRGGADRICGGRGRDRIEGDAGRDRIEGGAGPDRIAGGKGADLLSGGRASDLLDGGRGSDRCRGGAGRDRLKRCERSTPHAGPPA